MPPLIFTNIQEKIIDNKPNNQSILSYILKNLKCFADRIPFTKSMLTIKPALSENEVSISKDYTR